MKKIKDWKEKMIKIIQIPPRFFGGGQTISKERNYVHITSGFESRTTFPKFTRIGGSQYD